jgi:hypothetical protein
MIDLNNVSIKYIKSSNTGNSCYLPESIAAFVSLMQSGNGMAFTLTNAFTERSNLSTREARRIIFGLMYRILHAWLLFSHRTSPGEM